MRHPAISFYVPVYVVYRHGQSTWSSDVRCVRKWSHSSHIGRVRVKHDGHPSSGSYCERERVTCICTSIESHGWLTSFLHKVIEPGPLCEFQIKLLWKYQRMNIEVYRRNLKTGGIEAIVLTIDCQCVSETNDNKWSYPMIVIPFTSRTCIYTAWIMCSHISNTPPPLDNHLIGKIFYLICMHIQIYRYYY